MNLKWLSSLKSAWLHENETKLIRKFFSLRNDFGQFNVFLNQQWENMYCTPRNVEKKFSSSCSYLPTSLPVLNQIHGGVISIYLVCVLCFLCSYGLLAVHRTFCLFKKGLPIVYLNGYLKRFFFNQVFLGRYLLSLMLFIFYTTHV